MPQKKHRGRFQAQGGGTQKSVPWNMQNPITKSHAITSITNLENKLSPAELSARQQCFIKAYKYVRATPAIGVTAFFKHSCVPFPPKKDIRVDIDVLSGTAFVDD